MKGTVNLPKSMQLLVETQPVFLNSEVKNLHKTCWTSNRSRKTSVDTTLIFSVHSTRGQSHMHLSLRRHPQLPTAFSNVFPLGAFPNLVLPVDSSLDIHVKYKILRVGFHKKHC